MRRAALVCCAALAACGGAARSEIWVESCRCPLAPGRDQFWDGTFHWTHASTDGAAYRVELESWDLDGFNRAGRYRRRVHVFSLDGVPFECNQRLSYVLETTYSIAVKKTASGVVFEETVKEVVPSPCATEHRGTTRYQVTREGHDLVLTWPGGRQTLHSGSMELPDTKHPLPRYRWSNRVVGPRGDTRVELESWWLHDDGGSYERRVVVFAEDGRVYPCNGEPTIDYTERFDVEVHGNTLTEVRAHPAAHPCASPKRHLDSGELTFHGDGHVEILWRGGNRQVLAPQ